MASSAVPVGLYRPEFEHDACGVAFVVDMHGRRSHDMVRKGLGSLCHLEHRGASGAEVNTGDGAGILVQIPDGLYRAVAGCTLPEAGAYATGIGFLPAHPDEAARARQGVEELAVAEGLMVLGWRQVPIDDSQLGSIARSAMPSFHQVFIAGSGATQGVNGLELERRVFMLRKRVEHEVSGVYFASLSARTVVYKGMLTAPQLEAFFPDLQDERLNSRARAGPLPLLHQHLPELAPRPPLPVPGPQRRDQHLAGQPQLDARSGGAPRERPAPGRSRADLPDHHARRQ